MGRIKDEFFLLLFSCGFTRGPLRVRIKVLVVELGEGA